MLLAALVAALALAACGGDDDSAGTGGDPVSGDTSAEDVLDQALGGGGDSIQSGVLDLEFNLQSDTADLGSIQASLKGPFSSNGDGELPSVDFDIAAGADVGGPTLNFQGALILTPDGLWVNYGDQDYQLDDTAFAQVKDSYAKSSDLQDSEQQESSFSQFGVDPQTWLTDVTNEGTEDIDGTETVHVSGTGDIAKIVDDLGSVAEQSGQEQLDSSQLDQLEKSVSDAQVDVYADADDGSLRQLDVTLDVANGAGQGTSTVALSIGIADPNSDQEISTPEDSLPLSDLLGQFPGAADSLGGLSPGSTSDGADSGAVPDAGGSAEYYQCVQEAPTSEAVADCSKLLQ